jgi:formate hydrogenlyase subunit 6/NADH:ubiquinone oxidoreductase subunit I
MQISWIVKGLRTGVLTTRYPAVREPMPPSFRGQLTLDAVRCWGPDCDACVKACLPQALSVNRTADGLPPRLRLNLGACIVCGQCVDACPGNALAFSPDYELASRRIDDLLTDVTFDSEPERKDNGHRD